MNKTFYYQFNPIGSWLFLNVAYSALLLWCVICCPFMLFWPQMWTLCGTSLFSWLLWAYKYLKKHPVAVIDDKSITIDHCRPLYWKDVKSAEIKNVLCGFSRRKVIILIPKKTFSYKYNFLQKHNCGFTAFSLPLYDIIRQKDIEELKEIIRKKVKIAKI